MRLETKYFIFFFGKRERERKFYFIARASTTLGRSSLAVESTSESRKRFCRSCGTCRQRRRLEGNSPIMSQPQFCEKHSNSNFAKRHKRELRKEKKINCQCFCLPQVEMGHVDLPVCASTTTALPLVDLDYQPLATDAEHKDMFELQCVHQAETPRRSLRC